MQIAEEMWELQKAHQLNRWEFPMNMLIIDSPFTIEKNQITPTFKIKRRECAEYFKKEIEEIYKMGFMFPPDKK